MRSAGGGSTGSSASTGYATTSDPELDEGGNGRGYDGKGNWSRSTPAYSESICRAIEPTACSNLRKAEKQLQLQTHFEADGRLLRLQW